MSGRHDSPFELGRYITRSSWLIGPNANPRVKSVAYMPYEKSVGRLETSCYETTGLSEDEIIRLANQNGVHSGTKDDPRPVHGYALLREFDTVDIVLDIDFNNVPERHAALIGWERLDKQAQLLAASSLAERSEYHPNP